MDEQQGKKQQSPDVADVEGHGRRLATDQPQPGDEAEVEGNRFRRAATDQPQPNDEAEVEGHANKWTRGAVAGGGDESDEGRSR